MANIALRRDIYKILIRHTEKCKLHKTLSKALKPFIVVDPKEKAKEIELEIEKLG